MKYLIVFMCLTLTACASSPTPDPRTRCIHPGVFGGTPFDLPTPYKHTTNGALVFKAPTGEKVTLIGAICMKVEE